MITSKQNSLIKEIRSLADKKFRDSTGKYIVESVKLVKEALSLDMPITVVIGTEKGLLQLGDVSVRTEIVTEEVYKSVSEQATPQGVLAVIEKPINQLYSEQGNSLLLDDVSDPANVGAIIRTAASAGYNTIYMTDGCADAFSPKSVRASMSGIFRVKIVRADTEKLLSVIKNPITVADMYGKNVFENKTNGSICLCIGNEGNGVSALVRSKATHTVSISMENGMESLNAAVSAGILMYALK